MRKKSECHIKQIKDKAKKRADTIPETKPLVMLDTVPEPFSEGELDTALKKMMTGKIVGHDHISSETVKYLGLKGRGMMLRIGDLTLAQKKLADDWKVSIVVPIFKKGGWERL
ncbi:hypothetical protein ILUMI_14913 [Ignelater luminosus]|uniref:Uncharacterized protein n=1 Tax=Ignelater luminosus TaxID=2038154 RepID=A0A8K0CRJ0_IGNLU|nr:hypothetical protein ILUMI_14913 [Ignelater luminosus]